MRRVASKAKPEGQTPLARQAIVALMQAADGARRAMTRTLQPFGLTLPQFNVLTILWHHEELPTFQVAARMVEATPGITRLVSTLEAKGYTRRSQSTGDRRQQLCSLTDEGRRVVGTAIPPFAAAQQRLISDLKRSEALQMTALLQRLPPPEVGPVRLDAQAARPASRKRPRRSSAAPRTTRRTRRRLDT